MKIILLISIFINVSAASSIANKLQPIDSKTNSQYIKDHLNQKINWYKWNDHNLKILKKSKKPIFLHIGYYGCHWCNKMSKDNFTDEKVIKILNSQYISIIVDKDQHPKVNEKYLNYQLNLIGSKGWPANLWLLPNLLPYYASSYVSNSATLEDRLSFIQLLKIFSDKFHSQYEKAEKLARRVEKASLNKEIINLKKDEVFGGYKKEAKFVTEYPLIENQIKAYINQDKNLEKHNTKTLDSILKAAIYDKVNGGLHRYSASSNWETPHFEKRLHDNSFLIMALANKFYQTQDKKYFDFGIQTINFIESSLKIEDNLYASIISADVIEKGLHKEGAYYLYSNKNLPKDCFKKYLKTAYSTTSLKNLTKKNIQFCKKYYKKAKPISNIRPLNDQRARIKDMISLTRALFEFGVKTNKEVYIHKAYSLNKNILNRFMKNDILFENCGKKKCYDKASDEDYLSLLEINFKLSSFKTTFDSFKKIQSIQKLTSLNLKGTKNKRLKHLYSMINLFFDKADKTDNLSPSSYFVVITGKEETTLEKKVFGTLFPFGAIIKKNEINASYPFFKDKKTKSKTRLYICSSSMCFLPQTNIKDFLKKSKTLFK